MNLTAKVNGTDITKYLKFGGLSFSRNDVDGPTAGRTMDGTMIRDRVAIKQKFNAACRALTEAEVRTLYNLLLPETFTFTTNVITGTDTDYTCYSNNVAFSFLIAKPGTDLYHEFAFPIIEC